MSGASLRICRTVSRRPSARAAGSPTASAASSRDSRDSRDSSGGSAGGGGGGGGGGGDLLRGVGMPPASSGQLRLRTPPCTRESCSRRPAWRGSEGANSATPPRTRHATPRHATPRPAPPTASTPARTSPAPTRDYAATRNGAASRGANLRPADNGRTLLRLPPLPLQIVHADMRCRRGCLRALLLGCVVLVFWVTLVMLPSSLTPLPFRRTNVKSALASGRHADSATPRVSFPRAAVAGPDAFRPRPVPAVPSLVVHLDLKGSPPTMAFLKEFLLLAAAEGADGLLIEYEDMFPFEGRLRNLSARNAYSKDEVRQILQWSAEFGLHVVPLVQTFGHLEYVLKLAEFQHLRELKPFPQELCPSHPESMGLVEDMLRQVMALHVPAVRFLHVGCDEVFHLNACGRCSKRRLSSKSLFVEHVTRVARLVRSTFPGVTPLIWDDMLRSFPPAELADLALTALVEPVVWVYKDTIAPIVPDFLWFSYGRSFPRLWAAAAFRGASGPAAAAPYLPARLRNVVAWRRRQVDQGAGQPAPPPSVLVLTGWARYDHFAVLSELLPVALPSMVLALHAARATKLPRGEDAAMLQLLTHWRRRLGCRPEVMAKAWPSLHADPQQWNLAQCNFLGSDIFTAVGVCEHALDVADTLEYGAPETVGWLSEYHRRRNFSSPARALNVLAGGGSAGEGVRRAREGLAACRNGTQRVLQRYVDVHSAREWLRQRLEPTEQRMEALERVAARFVDDVGTWPRRPLD